MLAVAEAAGAGGQRRSSLAVGGAERRSAGAGLRAAAQQLGGSQRRQVARGGHPGSGDELPARLLQLPLCPAVLPDRVARGGMAARGEEAADAP